MQTATVFTYMAKRLPMRAWVGPRPPVVLSTNQSIGSCCERRISCTERRNEKRCWSSGVSNAADSPDEWSARTYGHNARFVSQYGQELLGLLSPRPGERVLDLGCGDGDLSEKLRNAGCDVIAVDSSPDMVMASRRRGLAAQVADGQNLKYHMEFDAVFTNAALHWMKRDPDAVISGVFTALKSQGRFVGEFGGHANVASISVALSAALCAHGIDPAPRNPWFFPSADEYRSRLEAVGFNVKSIELIPRPTVLPTGIEGWLETFSGPWLKGLTKHEKQEILGVTQGLLEQALKQSDGTWVADYVRLRFHATKP